LFIGDEFSKAFQNASRLSFEPFRGRELSKNKVQWLDLTSWLWSALKALPFANIIYGHFVVLMQILKPPFNF
jgi:hypothetical protein